MFEDRIRRQLRQGVPFYQQGGISSKLVARPHRVLSAPRVEAQLLLPLDLHHFGIVNDDLHESIANTLDGKEDLVGIPGLCSCVDRVSSFIVSPA
ncbi:MAG: hypothetical protein ACREIH_09480 [Nitrospiraceae bacterium]